MRPQSRPTFEPPRAGATRGIWNAWFGFLRVTRFPPKLTRALHAPNYSWRSVVVVLIPAYGWAALGRPSLARKAAVLYVACALVAVVCLGLSIAGVAAGVMITLHGLGVAEYFYSGVVSPLPRHRLARYVGVVLAVGIAYTLATRALLPRIVVPIQTDAGPVLVKGWGPTEPPTRGELIAFRTTGWRSGHFRLPAGTYLGRVYGLAGDTISFQPKEFSAGGQIYPRHPGMPIAATMTVPPGRVFVWPLELRHNFSGAEAASLAESVAQPAVGDVACRAYAHWFWRKQTYEPVR